MEKKIKEGWDCLAKGTEIDWFLWTIIATCEDVLDYLLDYMDSEMYKAKVERGKEFEEARKRGSGRGRDMRGWWSGWPQKKGNRRRESRELSDRNSA